ncbi:MAG: hypothetical protein A2W99_15730 [Bacteroidetes bacterium GWF2_33_16]|nr:MAG: hypothetical protein A2X00_15075 [Bacteroidetes bacterium GWE2_32_14]OFY02357.1 MAG: hypothetical protein A2W99_15730 [Bacteroidetes bacterium GWF2_33_16]
MREQNSDIDQIFKNNLGNYRVKAPMDVWDNIEDQLNKQSTTKRSALIKYVAAASIALIAVSATVFTFYKIDNSVISTQTKYAIETITEENNSSLLSENNQPANVLNQSISKKDNLENEIQSSELAKINKPFEPEQEQAQARTEDFTEKLKSRPIIFAGLSRKPVLKDSKTPINFQLNEIANLDINTDIQTKQEVKTKGRWSIGGDFAPSYSYRYLNSSEKNQENITYFNTVENPVSTFSGGLNIQYRVFNRLTVQTGVYYAQMGQSIGNMIIYDNKSYDMAAPSYKDNFVSSFTLSNSIGNIDISSKYVIIDKTNIRINTDSDSKYFFDPNDPTLNELESSIQQNFEYIDIPLIFRYKIIDKKVDFNIIAGASASLLIGNQVYLVINDTEKNIGKTKGIRETNYTGNFGLGIEFPLIYNLKFRLEPSFKYYLNAINPNTEIESHPYSFSVFSGFCLSL